MIEVYIGMGVLFLFLLWVRARVEDTRERMYRIEQRLIERLTKDEKYFNDLTKYLEVCTYEKHEQGYKKCGT